jgi:hypothetical protein
MNNRNRGIEPEDETDLRDQKSIQNSGKQASLRELENTGEGPGSAVGIATAYGLDGPWIESRGGKIFRNCPDRPWGPTSLLYNGYRVFPGGKVRQGRDADPSPLLVPRSKTE